MTLNGIFLVTPPKPNSLKKIKFEKLDLVTKYNQSAAVVVSTLNPNYYLLFGSLKLIITKTGSPLSHLAILGREHGLPIFRVEKDFDKIPSKGRLIIRDSDKDSYNLEITS